MPTNPFLTSGGGLPDTGYIYNPAAYGSIPNIPPTSTNTTTSSWTSQLPQYEALSGQASGLAGSWMRGELAPDVISNIQRQAAERGIRTGVGPGSPNANAAYLQALGLTTQQLQQTGLQDYLQLLAQSPRTTTQQQVIDNNVLQAITSAAPDPYSAALANMAAQAAGLRGGAGAGGGTTFPGTPLTGEGAIGSGPTYGGGGGTGEDTRTITPGTPGLGAIDPATGFYRLPTGNMINYGTGAIGSEFAGEVVDQSGDWWQQQSDGTWLNMSTGTTDWGPPSTQVQQSYFDQTGVDPYTDPWGYYFLTGDASVFTYGGGGGGGMGSYDVAGGQDWTGGVGYFGQDQSLDDWIYEMGYDPYTGGERYDYTADYAYPDTGYDYTADWAYPDTGYDYTSDWAYY